MNGENIAISSILHDLREKKGLSPSAAAEIMMWKAQELLTNTWHKTGSNVFKEGDISLEDKQRSGRPSIAEDKALLKMVEQQISIMYSYILTELYLSQSTLFSTAPHASHCKQTLKYLK